jgi:hypothetical protein
MAIDIPWILAPDFLDRILASGLERDQATLTIREIIRSTRPMPRWALAPGPAEPLMVRYALPEVARLDRPLDCRTLDIPASTIEAVGKMFGNVWAMPGFFHARIEFWTADVKRLFPDCTVDDTKFRNASDARLIVQAVRGIESGEFSNALQAAKAVAKHAAGPSLEQNTDRLRKAIRQRIAKDRQL